MRSNFSLLAALVVAVAVPAQAQIMSIVPRPARAPSDSTRSFADQQSKSGTSVFVFLDGNVKGAAEGKETNVASGVLGISLNNARWDLGASLNIAATRDTIREFPGQSLLVPGTGGFSAGSLEGRIKPFSGRFADVRPRGYLSVSSLLWDLRESADTVSKPTVANAVGWGLGLSWQIAAGTVGNGDKAPAIALRLDAGYMQRLLYGDVLEREFTVRRTAFLGSDTRRFSGYEIGAQLQYSTIRGSLVYYNFPKAGGVRGLTKGQIAAGFAIAAPILKGDYFPSNSR